MDKKERIKELIKKINYCNDQYFNYNKSPISDKEFDNLNFELIKLEEETGIIYSDSPTQTVGFKVQSGLKKVEHSHLMLSLGKTKDIKDIVKFGKANKSKKNKMLLATPKLDGITCLILYNENGDLIQAETRGNSQIGEDITENVKQISNVPLHINNNGVPIEVEGEVIVKLDAFDKINSKLKKEDKFAKPRNYASGSLRQLNTKITKERELSFIAWKDPKEEISFSTGLYKLASLGFEVVPIEIIEDFNELNVSKAIRYLQTHSKDMEWPIDGIVFTYDDVKYGLSLGNTSHHYNHSYAFKFYDDEYETTFRGISWNVGKSGQFAPTAYFDEVEIDGSLVSSATLSNISITKQLKLGIGDKITVSLRNMIIPKVEKNLTQSNTYKFPTRCHCGSPLETAFTDNAEFLYCRNPECKYKKLAMFEQFVSKHGMDIKGLSSATIEKFMDKGWLNKYADFYKLKDHKDEIVAMDGFGEKSYQKLINSIEKSRNCRLSNFLVAMSIPNIGKSAAETIEEYFDTANDFFEQVSIFDFTQLKDFGETMNNSIHEWWLSDFRRKMDCGILEEGLLTFVSDKISNNKENKKEINSFIQDKTFVITGKFSQPRSYYENIIKQNNGKVTGSVSKKTDFLLLEGETGSSKYNKAIELNIPILSEKEFLEKCGLN